ncbi:ribokinase [Jonesiaceae bacterium BS-20]|uniref:Ribokinase n=1 Tax=Jonesiaceae bacterium BS-20 TaxID=3120821 RepID=A0AAU7DUI2_9MICO
MTQTLPNSVVVFGSINMDITALVAKAPVPGETVLGTDLLHNGGGKGANQAVAAVRAGGMATTMIGALGEDTEGAQLRATLTNFGVDTSLVTTVGGPSGTALITVSADGENSIVVIPGANGSVTGPTGPAQEALGAAGVILAQLEVPVAAVTAAAAAKGPDTKFILNAAPSAPLPEQLWQLVDVLVVNEHEAVDMAGHLANLRGIPNPGAHDLTQSLDLLLTEVPAVLVTLGGAGSKLLQRGMPLIAQAAAKVTAVDTTAAGDTFCGVFAAALASGLSQEDALRRASGAAALTVQKPGAQGAIPSHDEVSQFISQVFERPELAKGNHA